MNYEHLPDNLRAICEGRRPDLMPQQLAAYRSICEQARQGRFTFFASSSGSILPVSKELVGTMLKEILESLDLRLPGCEGCQGMLARMNALGVERCRAEVDILASELRTRAGEVPLSDKFHAALKALGSGLAFQLNPLDPYPGLVAEAIRRAEKRSAQSTNDATTG